MFREEVSAVKDSEKHEIDPEKESETKSSENVDDKQNQTANIVAEAVFDEVCPNDVYGPAPDETEKVSEVVEEENDPADAGKVDVVEIVHAVARFENFTIYRCFSGRCQLT